MRKLPATIIKNTCLLLAAATCFGCTSDFDGNDPKDNAIRLQVQAVNATRAALKDTHNDFSVWANKGDYSQSVFQNYLVKYCTGSTGSTYGDSAGTKDGLSQWCYEGVKTGQILKYWDYSMGNHYFYACAPYSENNILTVAADNKGTYQFASLEAFYQNPIVAQDDAKVLNEKDALYTPLTTVSKTSYGKDVALQFKHLNALVRLAFYTAIPNTVYTVELMDLVPEAISWSNGSANATIPQQKGIVLTPATQAQATAPAQTAKSGLPKYHSATTGLTVTTDGVITLGSPTDGNDNLNFCLFPGTDQTVPVASKRVATSYYALPFTDNTATGFTLHVSFKLKTKGSNVEIKVYDARVWIPADKCKWEAGKCYTYVFKITDGASGTMNPTMEPDPNNPDEPYVDPLDPRVPENPALTPIIFDEVTVTPFVEESPISLTM